MYNIWQKYKSGIINLVKLLIITGAFYFISQKIIYSGNLNSVELLDNISIKPITILFILIFSLFNWLLEILKWKTLVTSVKNISFFESFKQSTSSLTASLLTPNRIGEYGAKAIYYLKTDRKKIMFLNLIGNTSQMFMTSLFGVLGIFLLANQLTFKLETPSFIWLFLVLFIIVLVQFKHFIWEKIILRIISNFKSIPNHILFKNLKFSFFRYLVFSHQFYFLLIIFGVDLDYFTAMSAIFTMYFIASIVPSFVVFDFIIKGSVAISIFSLFQVNEMIILSITTLMWLLNFALPSLIGSYYVLTFKYPVAIKVK